MSHRHRRAAGTMSSREPTSHARATEWIAASSLGFASQTARAAVTAGACAARARSAVEHQPGGGAAHRRARAFAGGCVQALVEAVESTLESGLDPCHEEAVQGRAHRQIDEAYALVAGQGGGARLRARQAGRHPAGLRHRRWRSEPRARRCSAEGRWSCSALPCEVLPRVAGRTDDLAGADGGVPRFVRGSLQSNAETEAREMNDGQV